MMREIAEQIKVRVPTRELCAQVGLRLDRQGNALCPFHGDKRTPSLKVYQDPARGWHCFGCNTGGSVIDFAMRWYGIGFRQAIVRLDADFGLGLPLTHELTHEERRKMREDARKRALERQREQEAMEAAEEAYWAAYDRYLACVRRMDDYKNGQWRMENGELGEREILNSQFSILKSIDVRWAACAMLLPEIRDEYERAHDALMLLRAGGNGGNAREPSKKGERSEPSHRKTA